MNARRSLDPSLSKPFNINIYYNINSRNITNNHEVQSHPVTARLSNPYVKQKQEKGKAKNIANLGVKSRKKKYSVDLTMPTDKKLGDKIGKKSNTNSICSGFQSQNNNKKDNEKQEQDKKMLNSSSINQKHEQKLGKLLQIFSEGKIDKVKLTKQILAVFQLPLDSLSQGKKQKMPKKKRSVSTLFGTVTPKNNRLPGASLKNTMNIHKARHRQSKSQKGSFMHSKNTILKDQITQKIIQCRVIDSSLCLQPDQEQRQSKNHIVDRANDVLTSYSIVLLNQNIKRQRKVLKIQEYVYSSNQHKMASIIQRAWRKYKTRKLITKIISPVHKIKTSQNSILQKVECISSSKKSLQLQNFLSHELQRKNTTIRNAEIARVQQLRDHEIKKWNQITQFVKTNINNRSLSSDQCLKSIITYFQKAKSQVQKQLMLDRVESNHSNNHNHNAHMSDLRHDRRQLTEFTNQIYSRQIVEEQKYQQSAQKQEQQIQQQNQSEGENNEELQQVEEQSQQGIEHEPQGSNNSEITQQQILLQSSRVKYSPDEQILKSIKNSQNLSLQIVQNAMIIHMKKLQLQYCTKLKNLDVNCKDYPQNKKKLQKQFKQQRKQIRRIIANLNKGYQQAKSILNKQALNSFEESQRHVKSNSSNETLQKCKSDNYLLKTAINYKKYVQRKEGIEQHKNDGIKQKSRIQGKVKDEKSVQNQPKYQSNAQKQILKIKQQIIRKLTKTKFDENLQHNSIESSDMSENSMGKSLQKIVNDELHADSDGYFNQQAEEQEDFVENKSLPFEQEVYGDEGGDGEIKNKNEKCMFNKLEQKIVSEQFLQYEQMHKQFDPDLQHSVSSLKSNSNSPQGPRAQQISLFENTKLNETNKKLKYLTNEDKDDIFQFVFIDLTLQLITEYDHETRVYKTIRNYVEKRKRLESIPKGVKTALAACKDYLGVISQSVQKQHLEMFNRHIMVPMGPTAKQMLKYMHQDQGDELEQENTELNVPLILPNVVFEKLENKIVVQYPRFYDDDTKQQSRRKFLKSIDHIHHKALFDSLNESLDCERPYGIWGLPFPWKTTHKNQSKFQCQPQQKLQKLKAGTDKVIQCCSYMCGILVDKQESVFGNHKVSQSYVEQIRQDRMSKMLSNQLHENEDRWAFYDDEETQVLIQLSKLMVLTFVEEAILDLNQIKQRA